jgi:hypothetical protein
MSPKYFGVCDVTTYVTPTISSLIDVTKANMHGPLGHLQKLHKSLKQGPSSSLSSNIIVIISPGVKTPTGRFYLTTITHEVFAATTSWRPATHLCQLAHRKKPTRPQGILTLSVQYA